MTGQTGWPVLAPLWAAGATALLVVVSLRLRRAAAAAVEVITPARSGQGSMLAAASVAVAAGSGMAMGFLPSHLFGVLGCLAAVAGVGQMLDGRTHRSPVWLWLPAFGLSLTLMHARYLAWSTDEVASAQAVLGPGLWAGSSSEIFLSAAALVIGVIALVGFAQSLGDRLPPALTAGALTVGVAALSSGVAGPAVGSMMFGDRLIGPSLVSFFFTTVLLAASSLASVRVRISR